MVVEVVKEVVLEIVKSMLEEQVMMSYFVFRLQVTVIMVMVEM
jgi:hypothetical protein